MRILFMFSLALLLGGCEVPGSALVYAHPQKEAVSAALQQMVEHSVDPFLIVEDPKSEKFVQFYNDNGRILLDLPRDALTTGEIEKAENYFSAVGVDQVEVVDMDPQTNETFSSASWQKRYPKGQVGMVANIAIGALREVYGFDETVRFKLTRGWE